jgi:K(+)-stimulated pyrophosphate-energized sodium pump
MNQIVYLVPAFGLVGLLYTAWKFSWVSKQDAGNEKMQELAGYIADGAIAFLKAEWKILTYFAIPTAILLAWLGTQEGTPENPIHSSPLIAIAFCQPQCQMRAQENRLVLR